jgi:hypothetical protein
MTVAALLLMSGLLSFAVGAGIPSLWTPASPIPEVWGAPPERYLELIAHHRRSWSWINGSMIAAVVLNAAGLAALAGVAGQPALLAGAAGYGIASVFWILVASYRNTVSVWAADEMAAANRLPDAFTALERWTGMSFQLYTAIGHGSQAAVGAGLLPTALVSNWVAWVAVVVGIAGFLSQLPGFSRIPGLQAFFIPIVMHVPPAIIGISLLVA